MTGDNAMRIDEAFDRYLESAGEDDADDLIGLAKIAFTAGWTAAIKSEREADDAEMQALGMYRGTQPVEDSNMADKRIKEISKLPKTTLACMHRANGGLMPLADYLRWAHEELVDAVIQDEVILFGPGTGNQPETTP